MAPPPLSRLVEALSARLWLSRLSVTVRLLLGKTYSAPPQWAVLLMNWLLCTLTGAPSQMSIAPPQPLAVFRVELWMNRLLAMVVLEPPKRGNRAPPLPAWLLSRVLWLRVIRSLPSRLTVVVMVLAVLNRIALGAAPQSNVIEPPRSRAANKASGVQVSGWPSPTTCASGLS